MDEGMTVEGLDTMQSRLQSLAVKFANGAKKTSFLAASAAKEYADPITPVRTGYLQSRNQVIGDEESGEAAFINDADYAPYVEFGTRHAPAQPFFTPAVEYAMQAFPDIAQQAVSLE